MNPIRLTLLHWFPIEQYPPAMNWIRAIAQLKDFRMTVVTTRGNRPAWEHDEVEIVRTDFQSSDLSKWQRLKAFANFPRVAVKSMSRTRPDAIWSCEPHSSLPAWWWNPDSRKLPSRSVSMISSRRKLVLIRQ